MGSYDDNFRAFLDALKAVIPTPRRGENVNGWLNEPEGGLPFTTRTLALTAAGIAAGQNRMEIPCFGIGLDAAPGGGDKLTIGFSPQGGENVVVLEVGDYVYFKRGTQILYWHGITFDGNYTVTIIRDRFSRVERA